MTDVNDGTGFAAVPPTTLADVLGREQVMDIGIRPLWTPVPRVAGVRVATGDIVVADEEGIVVTPSARREHVLRDAGAKLAKEAGESLEEWEKTHHARIEAILREHGFSG